MAIIIKETTRKLLRAENVIKTSGITRTDAKAWLGILVDFRELVKELHKGMGDLQRTLVDIGSAYPPAQQEMIDYKNWLDKIKGDLIKTILQLESIED